MPIWSENERLMINQFFIKIKQQYKKYQDYFNNIVASIKKERRCQDGEHSRYSKKEIEFFMDYINLFYLIQEYFDNSVKHIGTTVQFPDDLNTKKELEELIELLRWLIQNDVKYYGDVQQRKEYNQKYDLFFTKFKKTLHKIIY